MVDIILSDGIILHRNRVGAGGTTSLKKLNLPIIKGPTPDAKWLSRDDYVKFINFNLKYTFDRKANRIWEKMLAVNVPFLLK